MSAAQTPSPCPPLVGRWFITDHPAPVEKAHFALAWWGSLSIVENGPRKGQPYDGRHYQGACGNRFSWPTGCVMPARDHDQRCIKCSYYVAGLPVKP